MDRIYGRPAQASASQDYVEIAAGDTVEIRCWKRSVSSATGTPSRRTCSRAAPGGR